MNLSPLPAPPTDNLYKFQALSGLVMIVLTVWLLVNTNEKLSLDLTALENEVDVMSLDSKHLAADRQELQAQVDEMKSSSTNNSAESLKSNQAYLKEVAAELKKRTYELEIKTQEAKGKTILLRRGAKLARFYLIAGTCVVPVMLAWTWLGFRNWQTKIQDYQDRILQNEAEKYPPKKSKKDRAG